MRFPNPSRYHCSKNSSWVRLSKRKIFPKVFPRLVKLACVSSPVYPPSYVVTIFSSFLLIWFFFLSSFFSMCDCIVAKKRDYEADRKPIHSAYQHQPRRVYPRFTRKPCPLFPPFPPPCAPTNPLFPLPLPPPPPPPRPAARNSSGHSPISNRSTTPPDHTSKSANASSSSTPV